MQLGCISILFSIMDAKSSPAYRFGDLLALARQSWVRQMQQGLAQRGYPGYRRSDAGALRLLARGPRTIGTLGDELGVTRQAARKLVYGLQLRGYARTETDPRDRRRVNATLTPAGEAYARAISAVVGELNRGLAARVDGEGLRAADRVLRAVLAPAEAERANRLVGSAGELAWENGGAGRPSQRAGRPG